MRHTPCCSSIDLGGNWWIIERIAKKEANHDGGPVGHIVFAACIGVSVGVGPARAESVADFYKGKPISVVIGYPPRGGFDLTARLLIRHMPQHLPGRPTIIAKNM